MCPPTEEIYFQVYSQWLQNSKTVVNQDVSHSSFLPSQRALVSPVSETSIIISTRKCANALLGRPHRVTQRWAHLRVQGLFRPVSHERALRKGQIRDLSYVFCLLACLLFWGKVSLCGRGWRQTHSFPSIAFHVLGLPACYTQLLTFWLLIFNRLFFKKSNLRSVARLRMVHRFPNTSPCRPASVRTAHALGLMAMYGCLPTQRPHSLMSSAEITASKVFHSEPITSRR